MGPLVALANTLANLSRLKVLDISHCCLIGLARHRYHGLNALGNTFAATKNSLTHLRCVSLSYPVPLFVHFMYRTDGSLISRDATRQHQDHFFACAAEHFYSPLLRVLWVVVMKEN